MNVSLHNLDKKVEIAVWCIDEPKGIHPVGYLSIMDTVFPLTKRRSRVLIILLL
jgi:hypothetical protein